MGKDEIRHLAVFVAGTDEEYQTSVLNGITEAAKEHNFNVSVFASFGGVLGNSQYDDGEYNIYSLANYSRFDGAVLLTNTIGKVEIRNKVIEAVKAAGIPVSVLDSDAEPSFYNIRIDNSAAMRKMVEHVVEFHGAKVVNYISGPLENPEANARYHTFLDVMAEHGLPVEHSRVYFGGFRPIDGKLAAEEMLRSKLALPDAVICANDAMALEAASVLMANGVRIPEDIIITGFDNTYYAQHHCPTLSSVARPLSEAGKLACEVLLDVLDGKPREQTISLEAYPVFEESCGCSQENRSDLRSYKIATYDVIKRAREGISLLNRVTSALAVADTPKDCIRTIASYLNEVDCEQFCICLCDNWQSSFREGSSGGSEPLTSGYTRSMSAPLIWTRGSFGEIERFRSEKMYPVMPETGGNVGYFFPLHFRDRCLGYYVFTNTDFPTRNIACHSLMMNISHSFENIRKLLHLNNAINELDRLFVIDPLCGIYNRNGFIRLADKMFRECISDGETMMISFIDMDGLKFINDSYGHDEGDFALRRLAEVIRDCCTGDQICARFGGDEFIVVGTRATAMDVEHFEETFAKKIDEANLLIHKPYELGASIGSFVTEVTEEMKLFTLISQADQMMYEQKKRKRTSRYLRRD